MKKIPKSDKHKDRFNNKPVTVNTGNDRESLARERRLAKLRGDV